MMTNRYFKKVFAMSKFRMLVTSIAMVILSAGAAFAGSFAGTWTGTGTNNFDVSYSETIIINTSGSDLWGTYENSQAPGEKWEMKGSITGSGKAQATVFGLGNSVLYFTLKGNSLTYTWEWGKGKLTK